MGAHARRGRRRALAVPAAGAAVIAIVAGTVLAGLADTSAAAPEVPPAVAAAPAPTPLVPLTSQPAAAPPRVAAAAPPASEPTPTRPATPAPGRTRAPESAAAPSTATSPAGPTASSASRLRSAAPPGPPTLVAGTPCTATARACVDLVGRKAWLIDAGRVVRGPVKVMTGDRDDPTPRGTFTVQFKAEQYTSREYLVEMPYSVFFADGGIAFHEGRQDTYSAGCVKLLHEDAVAWFRFLQPGDEVQIR